MTGSATVFAVWFAVIEVAFVAAGLWLTRTKP